MRILLVKTSSLGDIIHNLPVLSDLRRTFPEARIDWCVEDAFADIPRLHPAVSQVIPVTIRRWRRNLSQRSTWQEMRTFWAALTATSYDAILDTQGLVKSALLARLAHGHRYGYAAEVAREPLAARFYDETFVITPSAHAVERNRWLAAAAFDYLVDLPLAYGVTAPALDFPWRGDKHYVVMLTASSRDDKLWDEARWISVAIALLARGLNPIFTSGNARERERALRIAAAAPGAIVAPPLGLCELAALIGQARLAIGVDTGLAHLATALGVPTIALYVSTDPALTGVYNDGFVRNLGRPGQPPSSETVLAVAEQALR